MDKAATDGIKRGPAFTRYQAFVIAVLAFLQFSVILDFMIISPLGAMMMPTLHMSPQQFGLAVSSYAFSAGVSSLLAAGFADRFDRKRLLLSFYGGFVLGTLLCALANTFPLLLGARIVTGLFGGVIGAIILAIATDLFPLAVRGRVMGYIQTAFAASQVLGLPAGLYFANHWDWHAPFLAIVAISVPAGLVIAFWMKPVAAHLELRQEKSPFLHLLHTLTEPRYRTAFALNVLLPTGGYMLMPFATAYMVGNVGLPLSDLPTIYLVTGISIVFAGPLLGRFSDAVGKFRTFCWGTGLTILMVAIWTNLGHVSLLTMTVVNVLLFLGIFGRVIPSQALISAIPEVSKRGAFNAVSASLQQFAGGVSSAIAGVVIAVAPDGTLLHFNWLGGIVMTVALISMILMYQVHQQVPEQFSGPAPRR